MSDALAERPAPAAAPADPDPREQTVVVNDVTPDVLKHIEWLGIDYLITRNIFARAAFRAETIGYTFKGTGALSNARDGDPATVDVAGARDTYLGGIVTVGYLY